MANVSTRPRSNSYERMGSTLLRTAAVSIGRYVVSSRHCHGCSVGPSGNLTVCEPCRCDILGRVLILLDQKDWIRLARAEKGLAVEPLYNQLLERVRALKRAGHQFPLVSSRYHEIAYTRSVKHRRDVAITMQNLSGYTTLLDTTMCLMVEMSAALHRRVPAIGPINLPIIGRGVTHAFGLKGMTVGGVTGPQRIFAQGVVDALMTESSDWFEFGVLAGEAATQGLSPMTAAEWRARTEQHGAAFAAAEQERQQVLRAHAGTDRTELDRITRGITLFEFMDQWTEVIGRSHLEPLAVLEAIGDQNVSIVEDVPGLDVLSRLRSQRFRDNSRPWRRSDFFDVITLQHGIPYCDIVSTDKHWAELARRSGAPDRYQTRVTGRPSELLGALDAIDERT